MTNFAKIRDIFFGNTVFPGSHESINEIAFLVGEGYLTVDEFPIASKEEYLNLFKNNSNLNSESRFDAAGGSDAHMALKLLGQKYLKDERSLDSSFETPFCGYFPDVMSHDKSIIIECGVTGNPEKILGYFRHGNLKELIQLPYPVEEDNKITAYSFKANPDLKDFLEFLESERNNRIRDLLRNSRKRI